MTHGLSAADVARLRRDGSAEARAETAGKLAAAYGRAALAAGERRIAEDIFRLMLRDAEPQVRTALAEALGSCAHLPREIARALADDVEPVALPMLACSPALSDTDLIEIVRAGGEARRVAVAGRETVSEPVSAALAETGGEAALLALIDNRGAWIGEPALAAMAARLHADGRLTPASLLRALCGGALGFFEAGVAALAEIPLANVRRLIREKGRKGRAAVLRRAGLPAGLLGPCGAAAEAASESCAEDDAPEPTRLRLVVSERVRQCFEASGEPGPGAESDDPAGAARAAAVSAPRAPPGRTRS